jgi:uncharacterized protein YbjT (DUF2867 family)/nitrite reductase/ring-hydroxylating ferredoxin subunit
MKVVVIGGTGLIGSKLVAKLGAQGHDVVAASPKSGVDTLTGAGVAAAVTGAAVVVDVSNSPTLEGAAAREFFTKSTQTLLTHEAAAGVRHHVALSVVGSERLPGSPYLSAKIVQEKLIAAGGIPFTIVHSTQFFEFVKSIADSSVVDGKIHLAPVLVQPIAADDVAAKLAEVAVAPPARGVVEIAGPETFRLDKWIKRGLEAKTDTREVVPDPHAPYFGTELEERSLVPLGEARLSQTTFEAWLTQSAGPPLKDNEFRVSDIPPGTGRLVGKLAVFNVGGTFCATQDKCPHAGGPLSQGKLEGSVVTCPWHRSQFDVGTGEVVRGPAKQTDTLHVYRVIVDGGIGRVEGELPRAVVPEPE